MSNKTINEQHLFELKPHSYKFIRRHDLTPSIRSYIAATACAAQIDGTWGKLTELSKQFMISRMFIYLLIAKLEDAGSIIFGDNRSSLSEDKQKLAFYYMLSLRLEGRCSLGAIATIMKRFNKKLSSIGSICQYLNYFGSLLPNTLSTDETIQLVIFASDEIFSKSIPVLVTVEPISSAILKIELSDTRKAEEWKKHWECLKKNGYYALYLVSDEGSGICTAQKEALSDIMRQPDTFHAISHRLGLWANSLESAAYKAIQEECDCLKKLDSAKGEKVIKWVISFYHLSQHMVTKKIKFNTNSIMIIVRAKHEYLITAGAFCESDEIKEFENEADVTSPSTKIRTKFSIK